MGAHSSSISSDQLVWCRVASLWSSLLPVGVSCCTDWAPWRVGRQLHWARSARSRSLSFSRITMRFRKDSSRYFDKGLNGWGLQTHYHNWSQVRLLSEINNHWQAYLVTPMLTKSAYGLNTVTFALSCPALWTCVQSIGTTNRAHSSQRVELWLKSFWSGHSS